MKNIIIIFLLAVATSCTTKTGKVGDISTEDISYKKDTRTGLCFAFIGAKRAGNFLDESESIGMACVPCEKIPHSLLFENKEE